MKLPVISGKSLIEILEKQGFSKVRQKGSHVSLQKRSESRTFLAVVPLKKEIKKGTLLSVIKQAGYTKEEFLALIQ